MEWINSVWQGTEPKIIKLDLTAVYVILGQSYSNSTVIKESGFLCPTLSDLGLPGTTLKAQISLLGYNQSTANGTARLVLENTVDTYTAVAGSTITGFNTSNQGTVRRSDWFTLTPDKKYVIQGQSGISSAFNGFVIMGCNLILKWE